MRLAAIFFSLATCFSICGAEPAATSVQPRSLDWLVKHPVIEKMAALQNLERKRNGLAELRLNPEMCLIAQRHATWMAGSGSFQHGWHGHAEIIHQGVLHPQDAVQGWIWSPAHHGIMLSGYTEFGHGYMTGPWGSRWVTIFK